MGFLDDMGSMLGQSLDMADRRMYDQRLQSQLANLQEQRKNQLFQLGCEVMQEKRGDAAFMARHGNRVTAVSALDKQISEVNSQIQAAARAASMGMNGGYQNGAVARYCQRCGAAIPANSYFCLSCGAPN